MITYRLLGTAAAALAGVIAGPALAQGGGSVVSVGSERAIKVGDTVLSRPFGAMLVDRLSIVGTQRSGGRTFLLVRGDAGGTCPSRYVVVVRQGDDEPTVSEPFGTCSSTARTHVVGGELEVAMPAASTGGPLVRYRYGDGRLRLVDATPAANGSTAPAGYAPAAASSCRTATTTDAATQQLVIADFERSYPLEYRRFGTLKRADITPDQLRTTVTGLACLAMWPGAEKVVPRTATPLFASGRYGPAAFATLAAVAQDPLSDANLRASVRAFAAEMLYRVERREPL